MSESLERKPAQKTKTCFSLEELGKYLKLLEELGHIHTSTQSVADKDGNISYVVEYIFNPIKKDN